MSQLTAIKNTEEKVAEILLLHPDSRESDLTLYARYIERYHAEVKSFPLAFALLDAKELKLPNYETLSRARRKIQAMIPQLRGTKQTRRRRRNSEKIFRDYARGMEG